jgi:hypothetical protein
MMRTQNTRLVEEADEIQRSNLVAQFPDRVFQDEDFALLRQFRFRVEPATLGKFHALRSELLTSFQKTTPENSSEFHRTLARQHLRIGYNLLEGARISALRELARAVRIDPAIVLKIPWLRVAALAIFGDAARGVHRAFFGGADSGDHGK